MATRLVNGGNGRAGGGQFAVGNPGGPGNPHVRQTARLRALLLEAVTDDDLRAVIAKLVELAKGGDLRAIKELFDRTLGKPPVAVSVDIEMACESCPARMTPEERQAKLDALSESLGLSLEADAVDESDD